MILYLKMDIHEKSLHSFNTKSFFISTLLEHKNVVSYWESSNPLRPTKKKKKSMNIILPNTNKIKC